VDGRGCTSIGVVGTHPRSVRLVLFHHVHEQLRVFMGTGSASSRVLLGKLHQCVGTCEWLWALVNSCEYWWDGCGH
jgi:hypothetical protein